MSAKGHYPQWNTLLLATVPVPFSVIISFNRIYKSITYLFKLSPNAVILIKWHKINTEHITLHDRNAKNE